MTGTRSRRATIRRARIDDAEQLAETAIAAWEEGFRGIVPAKIDPRASWRPERVAERLEGRIADPGTILAADVDGVVRGLALVNASRDQGAGAGEGEIVALYVHPDSWRRGLGRALVGGALDELRAAGYTEAIVWTLAASPRNVSFYEALGFERDGATQRRPSFGSPLEVRFRRRLDPRREPWLRLGSAAAPNR